MAKSSNSFYATLVPMYSFTQIIGLTPFNLSARSCNQSAAKLIYSILFMLIINIWVLINNYIKRDRRKDLLEEDFVNDGFIVFLTHMFDDCFSEIGLVCEILLSCILSKKIINLLQFINEFDKSTEICLHINLKTEYKKFKTYSIISICITGTLLILHVFVEIRENTYLFTSARLGELFGYVIPTILNTCIVLQFCTIAMCFKQRFAWLNRRIYNLSETLTSNCIEYRSKLIFNKKVRQTQQLNIMIQSKKSEELAIILIEEVRNKHYQLCDHCTTLNNLYSFQILIIILQDIITIIFTLYYVGRYSIERVQLSLAYKIYFVILVILALARIIGLTVCCSSTIAEAKHTAVLVHRLMSLNISATKIFKEQLQLEILFCSLQFLHQQIRFTACRIFPIGMPLIFAIIGAISMYMIIMIQFEIQRSKT